MYNDQFQETKRLTKERAVFFLTCPFLPQHICFGLYVTICGHRFTYKTNPYELKDNTLYRAMPIAYEYIYKHIRYKY